MSGFIPCDIVRLPCGSRSMQRTRSPRSANATPRLSVVVVFATPPFWLASAITCVVAGGRLAAETRAGEDTGDGHSAAHSRVGGRVPSRHSAAASPAASPHCLPPAHAASFVCRARPRPSSVASRVATSSGAVAVSERLDERAADRVAGGRARPLGAQGGEPARPARDGRSASSTAARIAAAQKPPSPVPSSASSASRSCAGAERLVGEERELPAVERLAECAVVVGERQPLAQVGRERAAQRVEPAALPAAAWWPRSGAAVRCAAAGSRAVRRRRGRPRSRRRSRAAAR